MQRRVLRIGLLSARLGRRFNADFRTVEFDDN